MANITFATPALVDAATVTTGNAATTMPVTNLQEDQPSTRWRTVGLSNVYAVFDLGSALEINQVILHSHNGSSAANWRIRAATSEANLTAAPGYDSGSISMWPATGKPTKWNGPLFSLLWLGTSSETFQYWRIDVDDAGNTDGYFQAGRAIIDLAFQPATNLQYGWGVTPIELSPRESTINSGLHAVSRAVSRQLDLTLEFLTEDEAYASLYTLMDQRGTSSSVFIIRDPSATTHLHRQGIYGLLTNLQPITNLEFEMFQNVLVLREML